MSQLIDLSRVTGFQWDWGNERKNAERHGVSQSESEQVFANLPFQVFEDTLHSQSETRFHAFGITAAGRRLHVTFTMREHGTVIRIISARDMNRRERMQYEQAT